MKPEIQNTFESKLEEETSCLLQNIAEMTDIIEANFSNLKDYL